MPPLSMARRNPFATRMYGQWPGGLVVATVLASVAVLAGVRKPDPAAATVTALTNSSDILIPGNGTSVGSTITVPPGLGSLQELTVTLHGLNHPEVRDIFDLRVTSPRGSVVHLMQQVGGNAVVSGLTVSFNDGGADFGSNPVTSSTYRPTGGQLTTFNGADPVGSWVLQVTIAGPSGQGSISDGWSLTLTTGNFPNTFTFSDEPLAAASTTIKSAHLTELRTSVNALRQRHGLTAFSFTDPAPTTIRGVHITELRSALGAVFTAMTRVGPSYSDATITPGSTVIKAAHFSELRAAILEADQMPLTVIKAGTGTGSVASSPPGIACGNDCTDAFIPGAIVTLTPTAAAGSAFAGWSGACTGVSVCETTMNAAKAVTATFSLAPLTLTIVKSGTGNGTITSDPLGINCGPTCVQGFTSGTAVSLYVNPVAGSVLSSWSGGGCSGNGACAVTVTSSTQVTAAFTQTAPATYDAQPSAGNLGPWGGCNSYVIGQQFQVTAPAGTSWTVEWFGADLGAPGHSGGVNKTSGTGNDTVVFTIDIGIQSPAPGRTCANISKYNFSDSFTFRFYNSSAVLVATRNAVVSWTYLLVN
jgi:hypothetical protein